MQRKELSLCAINKFYFCWLHINLIPFVAHFVLFIHCTEGLHHSLLLAVAQTQKFFIALRHVAPVFALNNNDSNLFVNMVEKQKILVLQSVLFLETDHQWKYLQSKIFFIFFFKRIFSTKSNIHFKCLHLRKELEEN